VVHLFVPPGEELFRLVCYASMSHDEPGAGQVC